MKTKALKFDIGKPRWELLCYEVLEAVARVMTMGAIKYDDNNWQKWEYNQFMNKYFGSLMRHISEWKIGLDNKDDSKKIDKESNENHMAHVICNAMMLMWYDENKRKKL